MKVLACYSNKGGVGKTAVSVNLAHGFAAAGRRTLLCDLDPQSAASFYLRVKPSKKLKTESFFKDEEKFAAAIRESDFENLDILPANLSFRDFDAFLAGLKSRRSRLNKALKAVKGDYEVVVLDCPPGLSALSETVFRAADRIVVPVVPTPLSERTLEQLLDFLKAEDVPARKLLPFVSMREARKRVHAEAEARLRQAHGKRFLGTAIPYSADVEKMGVHRAPVAAFARRGAAAQAYGALWREVDAAL